VPIPSLVLNEGTISQIHASKYRKQHIKSSSDLSGELFSFTTRNFSEGLFT